MHTLKNNGVRAFFLPRLREFVARRAALTQVDRLR
jgi:hypothetical protein